MSTAYPSPKFWENRKVLITGHTGFKGVWLTKWLLAWGTHVNGYSLNAPSTLNHFDLLKLDVDHTGKDISDLNELKRQLKHDKPEIVFHLAAQSLVRKGYIDPISTFNTNLMGTINVLEACRATPTVKALIIVTSDKCYQNLETGQAFQESDRLGGYDPYSSSKACCELATTAYKSLLPSRLKVATCRSGNIVGGGDWAKDRLFTDIANSITQGTPINLRHPNATRPWLHILDALSGYLLVGESLFTQSKGADSAWNFCPNTTKQIPVKQIIELASHHWSPINVTYENSENMPYESNFLNLDNSKAKRELKWKPRFSSTEALTLTISWYKKYYETGTIITDQVISKYTGNSLTK